MFELILVACLGTRLCEYIMPPMQYKTEEFCARQAAILAGMVAGRHNSSDDLNYRFKCGTHGGDEAWVAVDMDGTVRQTVWKESRWGR